jgi:16S rRNA (guanine527-N7)-methyltransferase
MSEAARAKTQALLDARAGEFAVYRDLLIRWQNKINLIGPRTLDQIEKRHFFDSAQLSRYAPLDCVWADMGSGAGFPGLVIGILQKGSSGVCHLIESDTRKAAFLRTVSRETGAAVEVHNERCEKTFENLVPDVVSSRAMASIKSLLTLTNRPLEKGAKCLFLKGVNVQSELTEAGIGDNYSVTIYPSLCDDQGSVVLIQKN